MIWQMNDETKQVACVAVARGHTHAVLAVAFPRYYGYESLLLSSHF